MSYEQTITHLTKRVEELEQKYHELLYGVASKFPDESRHETALRYILNTERGIENPAQEISKGERG